MMKTAAQNKKIEAACAKTGAIVVRVGRKLALRFRFRLNKTNFWRTDKVGRDSGSGNSSKKL